MALQFVTKKVGDLNLIFPERTALTVDFMFPQSAGSAHAMLQGFDLRFNAPDHQLKHISIDLNTHFGSGDRSGTVEVVFTLTDQPGGFDPISGEVSLLIVGN